jgi:hypothetical protein
MYASAGLHSDQMMRLYREPIEDAAWAIFLPATAASYPFEV